MPVIFLGNWWHQLNAPQQIFWGISIIFSVLFVIQFVISLIGVDMDTEIEGGDTGGGYALDAEFTVFSVRSIIAFFTFFGWTGVLIMHNGGSTGTALIGACISGLLAMFLVAYMMYAFSKLTQEGNIDMDQALFNTGEVYLTIPGNRSGQGKIQLNIQGSFREMNAITAGQTIPNGATIKVVDILDDNLLLVESI